MKMLNIGIIGTGHLGKIHTKLLKEVMRANLVGVYDLNTEVAAKVAEELETKSFNNLDEFFENVDAVSIVATTSAHFDLIKKAFEKNVHVFVEKPITSTIEQAEEVVKISQQKNLKLQVGHIERFNSALLSLEKYKLEPKFIQTDRLAQFNPRGTDVAVVLDLMIHDIDIILSLIKSKVKEVRASGVAVVSDNIDIANARIEFENGAVANVTASRISQKKMRKMRMFQRDSYITVDFTTGVSEVFRLISPSNMSMEHFLSFGEIGVGENKKAVVYEQPEIKEVNALKHELQLFVNAVLDDIKPVVSGEDGLRALRVAEIILEKIKESKVN
ncbi:MAG: Gfo/Idh/MocA family oxidoreductase [Ignavibacteriales bacterium]|nr:Gfo/Idh/MocA family oxidoreductase [Ignavibacteriales bacterium]MCB9260421.1 Gfo/Idh/MocA family oxidoreductase [Ignavibacteriales bacterium]